MTSATFLLAFATIFAAAPRSLRSAPRPPSAAPSTWNDRARFLAGLPAAPGSPLAALQSSAEGKAYRAAMDAGWRRIEARAKPQGAWARRELDSRIEPRRPLLYMFGGPDAIAPLSFFPEASAWILAGLEPVGAAAGPEEMEPARLAESLAAIRESLRTLVRTGFFRTQEMGVDLSVRSGREIRGVLPLLLAFCARMGAEVRGVERIEIDRASGGTAIRDEDRPYGTGIPGVRVRLARGGGAARDLLYLRVNLNDASLASKPGFFECLRAAGPANALLKAASFILADRTFSRIRTFLLERSVSVLQDDSGIPFRFFRRGGWDVTAFGTYRTPRPPFEKSAQPDLGAAFAAQPARTLPFSVGYHRTEDAALILAVRPPAK